jgi:hypothetical protein
MLVTIEAEASVRSAIAQRKFLAMVADRGLPEPDEMVVKEDQLVFLWLQPPTACIVALNA